MTILNCYFFPPLPQLHFTSTHLSSPPTLPSLFFFPLSSLNYREHWAKMGFWYHRYSPDPGQLICPSAVDSFHKPLSLPCSQLSHPCFDKHKWMLCLEQDFFLMLTVKWTACRLLTAMWTAEYCVSCFGLNVWKWIKLRFQRRPRQINTMNLLGGNTAFFNLFLSR